MTTSATESQGYQKVKVSEADVEELTPMKTSYSQEVEPAQRLCTLLPATKSMGIAASFFLVGTLLFCLRERKGHVDAIEGKPSSFLDLTGVTEALPRQPEVCRVQLSSVCTSPRLQQQELFNLTYAEARWSK